MGGPEHRPDDATGEEGRPLSGLAEAVARRAEARDTPAFETLFEREPFEDVDPDWVWDDLDGDEPASPASLEDVTRRSQGGYVVPTRKYCDRCRFFAEPPESGCTHDGTEILEFVDMEHAVVENCPVVEDRLDG